MSDRSYPARPILAASTAVIRDGRILVAQRANAPGAGLYSLPGGLVEVGETLAEAAARELMEEVGVVAAPLAICGHRDIIARDAQGRVERHFVVVTFAARWTEGEGATGPEAADVRWVTPDELVALPTTDGLGEMVRAAFAALGG
ncbi:MAG: NUDIX hydrolase [Phreatobacter sp.]|uniref:NUDIX hydrolase n=1 Tax=Phreatobacter sp. TaxID=1966341 RepID=UPI001A4EC012|nr:NUDIX hydrolase [Phreatobacter sp.]MBL8568968.1 NUDIX hydrolase [Phreatobacter sp.]